MGRLIMRFIFSLAPENVQSMWRHYKGNGLVCQLPYICLNDAFPDAFPLTYNQLSRILTQENACFVTKK